MGDVKYNWSDKYRPRKPRCAPPFSRSCGRGCAPLSQWSALIVEQVPQPRSHGLRLEHVQQDSLRSAKPAPEDGARLQVQHHVSAHLLLLQRALSLLCLFGAKCVCNHVSLLLPRCALVLNLFPPLRYPDLIDKTQAPTHAPPPPPSSPSALLSSSQPLSFSYRITRDKDVDTCIITFHAGPPYEDIAFRSPPRPPFVSHLIIRS